MWKMLIPVKKIKNQKSTSYRNQSNESNLSIFGEIQRKSLVKHFSGVRMMILQSATMTNSNVYSHNVPNQQHKADRDISGIGF